MRKPAEGESAAGPRSGQTGRWRPERGSWDASGLNAEPTGSGVAPSAYGWRRHASSKRSAVSERRRYPAWSCGVPRTPSARAATRSPALCRGPSTRLGLQPRERALRRPYSPLDAGSVGEARLITSSFFSRLTCPPVGATKPRVRQRKRCPPGMGSDGGHRAGAWGRPCVGRR
jgi:hypothetical protein